MLYVWQDISPKNNRYSNTKVPRKKSCEFDVTVRIASGALHFDTRVYCCCLRRSLLLGVGGVVVSTPPSPLAGVSSRSVGAAVTSSVRFLLRCRGFS